MGAAVTEGDLLEQAGKTLILFASIALVTLLAFLFLAMFSYVEPYYSIPWTGSCPRSPSPSSR